MVTILAYEKTPVPLRLVFIFKPLTTFLVILYAISRCGFSPGPYGAWILAGLAFSLFGDVFLMLPKDAFLPGLLSFLLTHVCYLVAFERPGGLFSPVLPFVFVGLAAVAVASWLWSGIPAKLKIPVLVYVALLAAMTGQGIARALTIGGTPALAAAAGSLLFLSSDSLLAIDKFKKKLPHQQALVLSTYFLAQWLIAFSLGGGSS